VPALIPGLHKEISVLEVSKLIIMIKLTVRLYCSFAFWMEYRRYFYYCSACSKIGIKVSYGCQQGINKKVSLRIKVAQRAATHKALKRHSHAARLANCHFLLNQRLDSLTRRASAKKGHIQTDRAQFPALIIPENARGRTQNAVPTFTSRRSNFSSSFLGGAQSGATHPPPGSHANATESNWISAARFA
jgi:hypothetical protein